MKNNILNWAIFIALSVIWGSSFILMKEGLVSLDPYQVAALRIVFSGIVLLPSAIKYFMQVPANKLFIIFMSGVLGSMLPAFLFCIAEQGIDSALTGTLNSLTPIFVIITGALFFQSKASRNKLLGVGIAIIGSVLLLLSKGSLQPGHDIFYVSLVVSATLSYGLNVNMVHQHLSNIGSLQIVAVALVLNMVPALAILYLTGYFNLPLTDSPILTSTAYAALLGIMGTAVASIIFYMLIKRAGAIFSSMVTYGIPIVANIWGTIYGEDVGWNQAACLVLILLGVFVANRRSAA